jgi:hypothetical protein
MFHLSVEALMQMIFKDQFDSAPNFVGPIIDLSQVDTG